MCFNQWRTVCCGWQCQMFFIYPIFCTSISDGLHAVVDSVKCFLFIPFFVLQSVTDRMLWLTVLKCFLLVLSRELEQWNANIAIAQVNLSPLANHRGLWSYPWQCQMLYIGLILCLILCAAISDGLWIIVVDSVKCFLLLLFFVLQSVTDCG